MDLAADWFDKWRLRINPHKTLSIIFGQHTKPTRLISINGQTIQWATHAKYLGIQFDRMTTFNQHIDTLVKKSMATRSMLYPVLNKRSPLSLKTKIQILQTNIRPAITYASEAWGSQISHTNWNKLERIQHLCLRTITESPQFVSNATILQSSRLPTLKQFTINKIRNMFFKILISRFHHIYNIGREHQISNHLHRKIRPLDWSIRTN